MIVERIHVEEGFLDGLDLSFGKGLNVLIGPRGAGKTSVIELIRFCLGARTLTEKAAKTSSEHALSILGQGSVTVTASRDGQSVNVTRTAEHWSKRDDSSFFHPVILSQNEIESVGLDATGRLRLIDSIRPRGTNSDRNAEEPLLAYIRSQTQERRLVCAELRRIRSQIRELEGQLSEAESLKKQHAEALSSIKKAQKEVERLAILGSWLTSFSVRAGVYSRVLAALDQWQNKLQLLTSTSVDVEAWPVAAGCEDPLSEVRKAAGESREKLREATLKVGEAISYLTTLSRQNEKLTVEHETEARGLRRQLETLKKGAGEIARRVTALQEKTGQLSALKEVEKAKLVQLEAIQTERKGYLDRLEEIRNQRFEVRNKVVFDLNAKFGPRIKVSIERAGLNSEYASAIVAALRGSGLRFNEAAPVIADQLSPREFVELVENENSEELARLTDLTPARAAKIVERIDEQGVEDILTAAVEDSVTLSLLDGTEYKTTEQLSTGQRCTVILPLLLEQRNRVLIVDQPEDHLDNGFIVETVVKAIADRKGSGQLIFSTHNANIPVLGDAEQVTLLASDGSRGFVRHSGPLDSPDSVHAITTVMEGGIEAFDRRSKFYHGSPARNPEHGSS